MSHPQSPITPTAFLYPFRPHHTITPSHPSRHHDARPSVYNEGMGAGKGCDKNHWAQRYSEEQDLTTKKKKNPQGSPVEKQMSVHDRGLGGSVIFACIPAPEQP